MEITWIFYFSRGVTLLKKTYFWLIVLRQCWSQDQRLTCLNLPCRQTGLSTGDTARKLFKRKVHTRSEYFKYAFTVVKVMNILKTVKVIINHRALQSGTLMFDIKITSVPLFAVDFKVVFEKFWKDQRRRYCFFLLWNWTGSAASTLLVITTTECVLGESANLCPEAPSLLSAVSVCACVSVWVRVSATMVKVSFNATLAQKEVKKDAETLLAAAASNEPVSRKWPTAELLPASARTCWAASTRRKLVQQRFELFG